MKNFFIAKKLLDGKVSEILKAEINKVLYPTIFFEPFVATFRPLIINLWRSFLREEVLVEPS